MSVDLGLSAEQDELVKSITALLVKRSSPSHVREAEPGGFDRQLWTDLEEIGILSMAVPEARGGWGATLVDLALVAEQIGRALAPSPVIETQVAARLLATVASPPAREALDQVLAGERLITIALRPSKAGVAGMVPAGTVCDGLVVIADGRLVLSPVDDSVRRSIANLAAAPLADIDLRDGVVLAEGDDAARIFDAALDEWLTLMAATLTGIGVGATEIACAYAAERRAFGAAIGSYQAISHRLADDATALDGSRLLTWKAAWSLDGGASRGRELAAMAFAFASAAAESATYNAVHVHGGYGFMIEHDVQLYYRRARGWPRIWGAEADALERIADARYPSAAT